MSSPLDVLNRQPKPKADTHVPALRFDIPTLTPEDIVKSVQSNKPLWRLLSQAAAEDEAAKRAKRISDRYDMTPIPQAEWEPNDDF
jgi:hypothetical protein